MNILLAHDDMIFVGVMKQKAAEKGCNLVVFKNTKQVINLIESRNVDVLLISELLHESQDGGINLLEDLGKSGLEMPLVVLAGFGMGSVCVELKNDNHPHAKRLRGAGYKKGENILFFNSPFKYREFFAAIESVLFSEISA